MVSGSVSPFRELVDYVLPDELWTLELLSTKRAEPLVLSHLLAVGGHELLQLIRFILQTCKEVMVTSPFKMEEMRMQIFALTS